MAHDFQRQKNLTLAVVAVLLFADAAMALYSFNTASSDRSKQELAAQITEVKLLKADVERARAIQLAMPTTKADCERFKDSLPSARTGYSLTTAELGELGHKSGIQIGSLDFHPTDLPARDMTEVSINATVTGNYKSIMRFLNGVQRSKNYYIVESLSLGTDATAVPGAPGTVRVDLHLKSYFKGAA